MDQKKFEELVARLEVESGRSPTRYQVRVALLALLGFGVLMAVLSLAGFGLLALIAAGLAILLTGGKALLLLVKLGKILIFLALPLWTLIKSSVSALFTRLPAPTGQEITKNQAPALFDALERMRRSMHGPAFHHVLITDDMNAAVVQRPAFGLFGWPRNYLILGLPLLESVSPDEALAIVAHEYGHLAGAHSRFAAYIYRLRISWGTISAVADRWTGWTGRVLRKVIGAYAPYFNAYTFVLARANEYQADAAASELVGATVAASALKRVNVVAAKHQSFMEQTYSAIDELPSPPKDIAEQWSRIATQALDSEQAQSWLQTALDRIPHFSDTHPALKQRLQALRIPNESLTALPEAVPGETAATRWLGAQASKIRDVLQSAWAEGVNRAWTERHTAIQTQKQRLAELESRSDLTLDEATERLRLRVQLIKDADHLPELTAFNAEHPDQSVSLYLEADWRLNLGDASGIDLLEKVISIDPNAIKPACERAWTYYMAQRDLPQAEVYQKRWRDRHEWEQERERQFETLNVTHQLTLPTDLDAEQLRLIHTNLHKSRDGIKAAYLARRIVPIDPSLPTYVIGVELTTWAALRKKGPAIVKKFASYEWPAHVFICVLSKQYEPFKDQMKNMPGATIPL